MPHAVEIGRTEDGAAVRLDIPTLIETRLLTTAQSGGGKSWTLRRLLERSHRHVQQIVIDLEGEFPSLREYGDYVLIGKGGDRAAHPREAQALARSALELQFSVIVDLSELEVPDRRRYVRAFLESLVNSPRKLWHPVLVVVDEAHQFCPQGQKSESAAAVVDLLARGRKRGLCAVLATQRLAKLDKDAAAECGNVLVGRTVMDVDRARAIDALAIVSRADKGEISKALMTLKAGAFYSAGVAFSPDTLTFLRVGSIETKHPQIGRGQMAAPAPPPSAKVQAVLAKLDHISRDEQEQANERETLRSRVGELQRELKRLEREATSKPAAGISDAEVRKREAEWQKAFRELRAERDRVAESLDEMRSAFGELPDLEAVGKAWNRMLRAANRAPELAEQYTPEMPAPMTAPTATARPSSPRPVIARQRAPLPSNAGDCTLVAGERKMLEVLWRSDPAVLTISQWGVLSAYSIKGGTFQAYQRHLKREGLIEVRGREVTITSAGLALFPATPEPMNRAEVLEMWRASLVLGERKMLDVLVDAPEGLSREELGEQSGYSMDGGTGQAYLRKLKRNDLAVETDGLIRLSEELR